MLRRHWISLFRFSPLQFTTATDGREHTPTVSTVCRAARRSVSSASRKASHSPLATFAPKINGLPLDLGSSCDSNRTFWPKDDTTSRVLSVEPSFTTIISCAPQV